MESEAEPKLLATAQALVARGQRETAARILRAATKTGEPAGEIWQLLGIVEHARGEIAAATSALEHATMCMPLSPAGQLTLAACYLEQQFRESARTILLFLAEQPQLGSEHFPALAGGLQRVGEYEAALALCERAPQSLTDAGDLLDVQVYCMRKLRRPAHALLPLLFRQHREDPHDATRRVQLAWGLHECGDSNAGACLLRRLPFADLECIRCLTLSKTVFQAVADTESETHCKLRLEILASNLRAARNGGQSL